MSAHPDVGAGVITPDGAQQQQMSAGSKRWSAGSFDPYNITGGVPTNARVHSPTESSSFGHSPMSFMKHRSTEGLTRAASMTMANRGLHAPAHNVDAREDEGPSSNAAAYPLCSRRLIIALILVLALVVGVQVGLLSTFIWRSVVDGGRGSRGDGTFDGTFDGNADADGAFNGTDGSGRGFGRGGFEREFMRSGWMLVVAGDVVGPVRKFPSQSLKLLCMRHFLCADCF